VHGCQCDKRQRRRSDRDASGEHRVRQRV